MNTLRNALAKAADRPWKHFDLDNDTKVRLGVGTTIGTCAIAMLLMTPI